MMRLPVLESSRQIVEELQQRLQALERTRRGPASEEVISSGCRGLDRLLPGGGFPPGALVEWLADEEGAGAGVLSLLAARQASIDGKAVVVLDRPRAFYPPAAAALGVDLESVLIVRARSPGEELWALDQILRCPAVGAAWGKLPSLDARWFRRLQLAAEEGGALGLLLRPASVRGRPSWAWAQFAVAPLACKPLDRKPSDKRSGPDRAALSSRLAEGRRWRLEMVRCRGGRPAGPLEVELDQATGVVHLVQEAGYAQETHSLRLAAELAAAKTGRRSSGA